MRQEQERWETLPSKNRNHALKKEKRLSGASAFPFW
jgi:hypothetical protein